MPARLVRFRWVISLITGTFFAAWVYGVFMPILNDQAELAARGAETTGRITRVWCSGIPRPNSKGRRSPDVQYVFRVGLTPYASTGGLEAARARRCTTVKPGATVTVTYLPENPNVSRPYPKAQLNDTSNRTVIWMLALATFAMTFIGSNALVLAYADAKARRENLRVT